MAMDQVRLLIYKAAGCVPWFIRNAKEVLSFERVLIYEVEVHEPRSRATAEEPDPRWRRASGVDLKQLLRDAELSKSLGPSFKARFDANRFQLFIGEDDLSGELAGYICYSVARKHITESVEFVTNDCECFIGPYYVKSHFRGRGHASEAMRVVLQIAAKSGMNRAYVDVGERNKASQQVVKKVGGRASQSGYLRIRFIGRDHALPFGRYKRNFKALGR